jgi:uncharacterized repeat protein (TIGR03803 family)
MKSIYRQVKYAGMVAIALTMLATVVILAAVAIPAQAQTETLLYQFAGSPDGASPKSGVVLKGTTLYGTTWEGGGPPGDGNTGYGIVYKVSTTTGKETILHTFTANTQPPYDGLEPLGGLAFDKEGNLYGTTPYGGLYDGEGYGTIYEITTKGAETVLYAFQGGTDGAYPEYVTPVFDKAGNLYGTTLGGKYGNGNVFKFGSGGLTTLYNFTGFSDGGTPPCGVTLDTKGNIYGVAAAGGAYGYGVLFEITAAGAYSVLYNFTGGADGSRPYSPPVFKSGKLYGSTLAGGSSSCNEGCGVIYEYTLAKGKKAGEETVLHSFNGTDGLYPMYGALVFDKEGNLYGTTLNGGPTNLGNVYELAPDGTLTTLYNFDQQPDGYAPMGGVVFDPKGNLYTTAAYGGNNGGEYGAGTVIKVTP